VNNALQALSRTRQVAKLHKNRETLFINPSQSDNNPARWDKIEVIQYNEEESPRRL